MAHEFHEFTRITKRLDNGDLVGRTNLTNFRASERRAELVRAMPSAAENVKKRAFYIDQLVELCVKCLLQKAVHAPCSLCWLHKWGGL